MLLCKHTCYIVNIILVLGNHVFSIFVWKSQLSTIAVKSVKVGSWTKQSWCVMEQGWSFDWSLVHFPGFLLVNWFQQNFPATTLVYIFCWVHHFILRKATSHRVRSREYSDNNFVILYQNVHYESWNYHTIVTLFEAMSIFSESQSVLV